MQVAKGKKKLNKYGVMRLIPQETVDNNLGPDRLEGPKALDPNIADNQLFDCTTFVWKS